MYYTLQSAFLYIISFDLIYIHPWFMYYLLYFCEATRLSIINFEERVMQMQI